MLSATVRVYRTLLWYWCTLPNPTCIEMQPRKFETACGRPAGQRLICGWFRDGKMPLGTKKSSYHKVPQADEDEDVELASEEQSLSDGEEGEGEMTEAAGAVGAPEGVLARLRAALPALPGHPAVGVGPSLGPCVNLKDSRHPWVAFFHVFFKMAALAAYLLGTSFTSNFVLVFVTCILLLAMDFWTVKNVSGRLLVGLRWWNEIAEDGENVWKFESIQDPSELRPSDSTLFWTALIGAAGLWCTFALSAILNLKISWLLIVLIAVTLQCSNVIGYYRCRKDAGKQMQEMVAQGMFGAGGESAAAGLTSLIGAAASGVGGNVASGSEGVARTGSQSDTV